MNSLNVAALSCVDIQKMNKDELTDISSMKLDPSVPQELRAAYMLKEMGNPYCFRVGDLGVKVEFLDNAPPLQDALSDFFQRKKKRAVILFPIFWTLCPEVESSLMGAPNRVTIYM